MEVIASGITLATAGLGVSKVIRDVHDDYKDIDKQIQHSIRQGQQLRMNLEQLNRLSKSEAEDLYIAQEGLEEIEAGLPANLQYGRKRDRFKWLWSQRDESMREIKRLNAIESSMALNILMRRCEDIDEIKSQLTEKQFNMETHCETPPREPRDRTLPSQLYKRERKGLKVHQWSFQRFGLATRVVQDEEAWCMYVRLHLAIPYICNQIVTGRLQLYNCFPTLSMLRIMPQNTIPESSSIISACQLGDVYWVRSLLQDRKGHPNDRTADNVTVFRHAIRSGNPEVVQLLLENGADPNLTFGEFETSPLDNAFLIGNADVIRLLLHVGADLDFKNGRIWTPLSSLWDSSHTSYNSTSEILEICVTSGFVAWNDVDRKGWSAVHRAGAYGSAEDIYNLQYKGANLSAYTTDFLFGPITCAVREGNESTFDALVELLPRDEIVGARDARGWSLLHFAAKNGSEYLIRKLIELGVELDALTVPTYYFVAEGLVGKRLTAEIIVRAYGHGDVWDKIIKEIVG